jgi:transcription antitermination factor NusG
MTTSHWAVCRILSNKVHRVRPDIEKTNHGTFMPTYAKVWAVDGKLCIRERAFMPGYLFFMTEPESWGAVANVDGVFGVLTNDGKVSRVPDKEMCKLVLGHATRQFDQVDLSGLPPHKSKRHRRRRPRPGKAFRGEASAA